ncbi:periplasmic binding II [Lentinula edodes]|uniref:Periplasmic binding II n=1 Tax=Lentinula edodes TaxID=5353 RepID=A0A1Q3EPP7_LENED|nr:periplasmic binding II [Lentinula edodes]
MPLRIGYVREHFSSPLLQFAEADEGRTIALVECPSGTGQLISRLTKDEIDVAMQLCDHTTQLGRISRLGSGSQTMAYVMGFQQGWPSESMNFQVNNDIRGLIDSVNDHSTAAFMWEWFTTKPWLDSGEVRFIGSVPTPWPSWLVAAQPSVNTEALKQFLTTLSSYVRSFDSAESRATKNVNFIKSRFGYGEEDIEAWMKTVGYPQDCLTIPKDVLMNTLSVLENAGVVKSPEGGFTVERFIDPKVVKLA